MRMHYSSKMKIAYYIAIVISLAIALGAFIYYTVNMEDISMALIDAGVDPFIPFWLVIIPIFAVLSAFAGIGFIEHALKNIIKKTESFRSKMNYCYSCSTPLKEATTTDICPECHSKLNLLDVIDVGEV